MDKADLATLVVSLLIWAIPITLFYALQIPPEAKIPTHWGINGRLNGWTTAKDFPAVIGLMAMITVVVWGTRFVYPRQQNVEKFSRAYNAFVVVFSVVLASILSASVLQTAGYSLNMSTVVTVGVGALLAVAGVVTFVSKQNWAIGIRTPWGLESKKAWEISNKIGGVALVIGGILVVLDGFGTNTALIGLVVTLVGVILAGVAAYVVWRREQ